jgi:isoleucyl-tRNA synthetase
MKPVSTNISFPQMEEEILAFWKENQIFERSMDRDAPTFKTNKDGSATTRDDYIFYDGPPFATGLPHYGHLLAGTIKDVVGRFFTMKGKYVHRRFGWDCHGLPVEYEIQKALNLHGAKAIREFGVDNFNEECRKIVLRYTKEWESFVERSGRWVDFNDQYRTMDIDFMETVWWVLHRLWERGLVYEGFKNVPYSWAINTPLSNFEVNSNYKDVTDPAITVRVKLFDQAKSSLKLDAKYSELPIVAYVWTTTPWTLPSNMGLAVGAEMDYLVVENPKEKELAIVAENLLSVHFPEFASNGKNKKEEAPEVPCQIVAKVKGQQLLGLEYDPIFPYFAEERKNNAFRIYPGKFVTDQDGTGIVHLASFGEDDLTVFLENKITVTDPVDEDGNFTDQVPDFEGMNVKAADPKIINLLKQRGQIVSQTTIKHSYPFCWRTDTPLIHKSISTWFVKVDQIKEELVQMNSLVHWVPEHIKEGRMGNWLGGARDWAISRNRFWGTPLPIWNCESCSHKHCMSSVAELEKLSGEKVTDLHSHFIDHLTFDCSECKGQMKRVPEVLDCWFESGSMPYAQRHYPFENKEEFEENFPADFIAEGLDQTRGWFYTLLVLSTALFGRPAFKNVIVNGILLAEDGKKMSKSLKNYPPPDEIMNEMGADAMRLYLLSSPATRAEELRFAKTGVKQVVRQTLLPLWNAYNFFVTYALVDQWTPAKIRSDKSPNLLDQWILSKAASLVKNVDLAVSNYHLYSAAQPVLDFVDELTNWYIRLNRRRFWSGNTPEEIADKEHAYSTLYRSLVTFVRVLAPMAPFISDEIFKNLNESKALFPVDSVHLTPYPTQDELQGMEINKDLEEGMEFFEEVILLGRNVRNENNLKVRQPLKAITIIHPNKDVLSKLKALDDYVREELNVKEVIYSVDENSYVTLKAQLNTQRLGKVLGPKLGSDGMKKLRDLVEGLASNEIWKLESGEKITLVDIELERDDLIIKRTAKEGLPATASSGQITVCLDTTISRELELEGLAREFVNRVQKIRKDSDFDVSDRVAISYLTAFEDLTKAVIDHNEYIVQETLAVELCEIAKKDRASFEGSTKDTEVQEIDGHSVIIAVTRVQG